MVIKPWGSKERIPTYARNTIRDGDGGKVTATMERTISYTRNTFRNVDEGKATALTERIISYACNVVWDDCILTPYNKSVIRSFYNCITVVPRIIYSVSFCYSYGYKTAT